MELAHELFYINTHRGRHLQEPVQDLAWVLLLVRAGMRRRWSWPSWWIACLSP